MFEATVAEVHGPISSAGGGLVVRHQHECAASLGHDLDEQVEDHLAGRGVEVAGGLVGQHELGFGHECAGDGGSLHLATRELARLVSCPVSEPKAIEELRDPPSPIPASVEKEGELDVLGDGQTRHEVEELEDEPDLLAPQPGALADGEPGDVAAAQAHGALVGTIEAAGQVQEGRLARAAATDEGDRLAVVHHEVDAVERDDLVAALLVALGHPG